MVYGDYTPASGGRPKPLTKKQLAKAREAYEKADMITAKIKELEAREEKHAEDELREILRGL